MWINKQIKEKSSNTDPDGLLWIFQKQLISFDFPTQPSLGFTENDLKKRNSRVSDSSLGENLWLMSEVRGEWAECFDLIGRQQWLKPTHKVCRRASRNTQHIKLWGRCATTAEVHMSSLNWTRADQKNAIWYDEAWFLPWFLAFCNVTCCEQHESTDPSWLESTFQFLGTL